MIDGNAEKRSLFLAEPAMDIFNIFSFGHFGQGRIQVDELILAFILSSIIGLERELRMKSAGLRTHTLVGLGAALLMLVSKFGFSDILGQPGVSLDPSRVAAQIVSGIGFIGGGLIFVRKDIVHGLTTAATIWLTAAIGMACGGGLPILAVAATIGHFIAVFGYSRILRRFFGTSNQLVVRYKAGREVAARVLTVCTASGFVVRSFTMKEDAENNQASMVVRLQGSKPVAVLAERISRMEEIVSVNANASHEEE